MKNGQKLKIRDAHALQEISKRYKHQSLGCPRGTPSSSAKIRSPFKTLYFYSFMHYAFFMERLYFFFSYVLFAAINGWTSTNFFLEEMYSFFICKEHSVFHSYRSTSVPFFLELRLVFAFRLDFCSDHVLYFHQGVFVPLVYVGIHQKSSFKKV
jgi:hypothetical protein